MEYLFFHLILRPIAAAISRRIETGSRRGAVVGALIGAIGGVVVLVYVCWPRDWRWWPLMVAAAIAGALVGAMIGARPRRNRPPDSEHRKDVGRPAARQTSISRRPSLLEERLERLRTGKQ